MNKQKVHRRQVISLVLVVLMLMQNCMVASAGVVAAQSPQTIETEAPEQAGDVKSQTEGSLEESGIVIQQETDALNTVAETENTPETPERSQEEKKENSKETADKNSEQIETTEPETEAAILTINYLVELYDEKTDAFLYKEAAKPLVISKGLTVGQEIDVADYVQDFSEKGLVYRQEQETVILEKETTLNLIYTAAEDSYAADTLAANGKMHDFIVDFYIQDSDDDAEIRYQRTVHEERENGQEISIGIPEIEGYTAYVMDENGNQSGEPVTEITRILTEDTFLEVVYVPDTVEYTVRCIFDNAKKETEEIVKSGKVHAMTEVNPPKFTGFVVKFFNEQAIEPEGTVVEVHYSLITSTISFDSQGGTFKDPVEVNIESAFTLTDPPTRTGYTFSGWYTKPNGQGEKVEKVENVTEDTTLYAAWNPQNVNYTISYWRQKVSDNKDADDKAKTYDFVASKSAQALVGTDLQPDQYKNEYLEEGYRYNTVNSKSVKVEADGTTVINIYYDRVLCTVEFYTAFSYNNDAGSTGNYYNTPSFTYTGLFGAPFTNWDTSLCDWYSSNGNEPTKPGDSRAVLLTSFDFRATGYSYFKDGNGNMVCRFWSKKDRAGAQAYYYNELPDGSYRQADVVSCDAFLMIAEKYEGYELYRNWDGQVWAGAPWMPGMLTDSTFFDNKGKFVGGEGLFFAEFYSNKTYIINKLKKYDLTYYNYNGAAKTVPDIKYTAPLEDYGSYIPERPAGLKSYYVFKGWYADQACTVPFDFTKETMPNANLQVYAKWEPQAFTVTVHTNDDNNTVDKVTGIPGGTAMDPVSLSTPVKKGYEFKGWYLDEACTQPFSLGKIIESDLDIYAKWEKVKSVQLRIRFMDKETGEEIEGVTEELQKVELDDEGNAEIAVKAKNIAGYVPIERFVTVNLNDEKSVHTVNLYYKKQQMGYFILQYIDENGDVIYTETEPRSNDMKPSVRVTTTAPEGYICTVKYVTATEFGTQEKPEIIQVPCRIDSKSSMKTVKTLINQGSGKDGKFQAGETAMFNISVENTGNVTLKNVTVSEMEGAEIREGDGYTVKDGVAMVESLAPGAKVSVTASYQVTQADVDKGGVTNVATVTGEGTDPQTPEVPVPTDEQKPSIKTAKTLTNQGSGKDGRFLAGETAMFTISVENTGNVTLKNVTVSEMEGAEIREGDGYKVKEGVAMIDSLAPGAKVSVTASYQVTQADVDKGGVTNVATVTGEGTDPQNPEVPVPTDEQKPSMKTVKTLTNQGSGKDGKFQAGETAMFSIIVENTGNVALKNVTVSEMEGAVIEEGTGYTVKEGKAAIASLAPGAKISVTAAYQVTQADVDKGGVTNVATVTGEGTDPQTPEVPVPTDEQKPSIKTAKTLTNQGSGKDGRFLAGETAMFTISVENTGNVTLKNVTVSEMEGASIEEGDGYTVKAGKAMISSLAPGAKVAVAASYRVTQADVDNGGATNVATVTAEGPNPEKPLNPKKPKAPIPTEKTKKHTIVNNENTKNSNTEVRKTNQAVKTGDETIIVPYIMLLLASAVLILILVKKHRQCKAK